MTKTQLLKPYENDTELRLLLSKVLDKKWKTQTKDVPTHTAFLTPRERSEVEELLQKASYSPHLFFGGCLGVERSICAFLPSWLEEEMWFEEDMCPLCVVEVSVPSMATLGHRDYLGALMGVGLTREKFGDIMPNEHGAQVILLKEVLPIVLTQWDSVGKHPITVTEIPLSQVELPEQSLKQKVGTVASLRLDSVLSVGFSIQRSKAVQLIEAGKVLRNDRLCEKANQSVQELDRFSCRGLGKFVLKQVKGTSRKGRVILEIDCYQ